ncbi:MAG: galactose mutarotase [Verrucomicrobiaceae bacterium]|nr:galactose mutarotase [Verrucomicrobiaceae bacterium]
MRESKTETWGTLKTGQTAHIFTLRNQNGLEARITDYGGILVSLKVPDKTGALADVVLGFDTLAEYEAHNPFFGCITGRYANRIGGATFKIDGREYKVTANSGRNHIHGGKEGFDKKLWSAKHISRNDAAGIELSYRSTHGEEGFPGTLECKVEYLLADDNTLTLDYSATTDAPTAVNLTNHSYFNLAGEGGGDVLGHELTIPADKFTPTDDELIPTGEIAPLAGTPLDFTTPHLIGERIGADFRPLIQGKGYDHNFVLNGTGMKLAARARDPKSGRVMEVRTTAPGVQLYTANHTKTTGKSGHAYQPRSAFCLETQFFPDSPNQPAFPSCVLRPGDTYRHITAFKFTVE